MNIRFVHTSINAKDWRALAAFYTDVFGCLPIMPEKDLSGEWIDSLTGSCGARIRGMYLSMPGCEGVTLEIFSHEQESPDCAPPPNTPGFGHLAFHVKDLEEMVRRVTAHGGHSLCEIAQSKSCDIGTLNTVYVSDPEGNIIELQNWGL